LGVLGHAETRGRVEDVVRGVRHREGGERDHAERDRAPVGAPRREEQDDAGREQAGVGVGGEMSVVRRVGGNERRPDIGDTGDVSRFASRDRFAAYNGTAPIEVSSGPRKIHRLSRRGNRRLNHAIHMVAVTQIRFRHSDGRAFYDRKIAEGKTGKEALRALKRRISDALYRQLQVDARRAAAGPGGQAGNDSEASVTGLHPEYRLFGEATPGPAITLRPPSGPARRERRSRPREAIETRS
jgi:Transposase IS116/IS110/IS902 family